MVDAYYSTKAFGDTTLTVVNEGTGVYREAVQDGHGQEVDPFGKDHPDGFFIGFHVVHILTPDASILVDAGFDDPDSEWGREFASSWFVHRTPGISAALLSVGESRETITHLAITHAHFDHVAGLTMDSADGPKLRFPNARVYLGEADCPSADEVPGEPISDITRRLRVVEAAGLLEHVNTDLEIAPGVTMIHTGGESPGHSIIRVASSAGPVLITGDLFHYPFEVEHEDWMLPWAQRDAMLKARNRVIDEAVATDAVVLFTHHPFPPWGKIVEADGEHRWRAM